jgi:predicted GNAT superfamily acetyltransferase
LALAVAMQNSGSIWLGAFDGNELIGFAFAFPSVHAVVHLPSSRPLEVGFHSHTLAVREAYRDSGIGYKLKLAQRQKAVAFGIAEMTWTFDPLRSRNAHLNFCKLGVVSNSYRADFYGPATSSPLHTNSTDRLWVTWQMSVARVEERLRGKPVRAELIDTLAHVPPLVRFNGDGVPVEEDLSQALARRRIAIEIPGDIEHIEREDRELARRWRMATRHAFTQALEHGFVVTEFCRSIRGQQGPGAYLLERAEAEA